MEATENKEIDLAEEEQQENENLSEETQAAGDEMAEDKAEAEETSEAGKKSDGDSAEEESAEEEGAEEAQNEKKGLFKKKEKKNKQEEKIAELSDRVQRQMAEFDNFRKRTEKEKAQMFEVGARSIIEKILPVVDNFERGLSAVPEESKGDPFVEGMDKIYKQLMTELENLEVKPIEAVGAEFDPEFHNAVMQVESDEFESGVVAQELQKGYMYRDSVVRHSMVAVVQ